MSTDELIAEQIAYYEARAPEYEDAYERRGAYDRGADHNRQWKLELASVERALLDFRPEGDVLELACGTGHWTRLLARTACSVMAVDASSKMLDLARARTSGMRVEFVDADLFSWEPSRPFDVVFFGFWLTHVPPPLFSDFWDLVYRSLREEGRVFFVDGPVASSRTRRGAVVEEDRSRFARFPTTVSSVQ